MINLITADGKTFEIEWIGISTLDGALRFGVKNVEVGELLTTFTNPKSSTVLTRSFDGEEKRFEGYTVFRGITVDYDGVIIVALSKI